MRNLLLLLTSFVTLTALCCRLLLIYEPDGSLLNLSADLLNGTPFKNFFLPAVVLTVVVGGINLFALVLAGSKHPHSYRYSLAGGNAVLAWIVVQMLLTQSYHWLQLVYGLVGLLIVLLSLQLMGKAAF